MAICSLGRLCVMTLCSLYFLQCVAVCCSVLQCVAVCCGVLPCVAAWLCVLVFWSLSFFGLFGQQTVQISNACRTVLRLNTHTLTQCLAIVERTK